MPNPETGKHKGFGFIEFEDPSAAQRALMNQIVIAGRQVRHCSRNITSTLIIITILS